MSKIPRFLLIFFIFFQNFGKISGIPVVCYYILHQPEITDVPIDLCTHIILINSLHINEISGDLQVEPGHLEEFSKISEKRQNLKLLVSVTSSNPSFSLMTSSKSLMIRFTESIILQLDKYNLNGVDIDWEFPTWSHDSQKIDKINFSKFLEILKSRLSSRGFLLSVAVSGPPTITRTAYDVQALSRFADMVQIMNYDFHIFNKFTNPLVGFNAPLHPLRGEFGVLGEMNSEASMKTWSSLGLPKNQSIFGIPTYARAFQLLTHYLHKPYSPAIRTRPEITNYDQVCPLIKDPQYTKVWNRHAQSPYLYGKSGLWVSYENPESIRSKVEFAKSWGAGGIMVFSIGSDDFHGKCGNGKFPLLREISKIART